MIQRFRYGLMTTISVACLFVILCHPIYADTLYERYTTADRTDLEAETSEMSDRLREVFNPASITACQQDIDFSKYFSNLKKLVIYSTRLSAYSEYEKDLHFARDKDIFKGLPDARQSKTDPEKVMEKKTFVKEKYVRMKKNVQEEIDTYEDMILLSLDVCENMAGYDLSNFLEKPAYQRRIIRYKNGKEYRIYQAKRDRMILRWPDLADRVQKQFSLWETKASAPTAPIIDIAVTGAL